MVSNITTNRYPKTAELPVPGKAKVYPEIVCDRIVVQGTIEYGNSFRFSTYFKFKFDDIVVEKTSIDNAIRIVNETGRFTARKEPARVHFSSYKTEVLIIEPVDRSTVITNFILESINASNPAMNNTLVFGLMGMDTPASNGMVPFSEVGLAGYGKISFTPDGSTDMYEVTVVENGDLYDTDVYDIPNVTSLGQFRVSRRKNTIPEILKRVAEAYPLGLKANDSTLTNISRHANYTIEIEPLTETGITPVVKGKVIAHQLDTSEVKQTSDIFLNNRAINSYTFESLGKTTVTLSPAISVNTLVIVPNEYGTGIVKHNDKVAKDTVLTTTSGYNTVLSGTGLKVIQKNGNITISNPTDSPITISDFNVLSRFNSKMTIVNGFKNVVQGVLNHKTIHSNFLRFASITFDNNVTQSFTNKLEFMINGQLYPDMTLKDWEIDIEQMNIAISYGVRYTDGATWNLYFSEDVQPGTHKPINPNQYKVGSYYNKGAECRIKLIYNDKPVTNTVTLGNSPIALTKGESVEIIIPAGLSNTR